MHDNNRKRVGAFVKGLMLVPLVSTAAVLAAEPVESLVVRIESVNVPAKEIRADGVDYSLSGRATVTLQQGERLALGDLQPGMRIEILPAKTGGSVLDSVVLQRD